MYNGQPACSWCYIHTSYDEGSGRLSHHHFLGLGKSVQHVNMLLSTAGSCLLKLGTFSVLHWLKECENEFCKEIFPCVALPTIFLVGLSICVKLPFGSLFFSCACTKVQSPEHRYVFSYWCYAYADLDFGKGGPKHHKGSGTDHDRYFLARTLR
jgi:hypothetical protein